MPDDESLRDHLRKIFDWADAHGRFDRAIDGVPAKLRGRTPEGWAHSPWQLLEHIRICQLDILDFCRNPKYVDMPMEKYWPPSAIPPSDEAWDESVAAYPRDRSNLKKLAADPAYRPVRADPARLRSDVRAGDPARGRPQCLSRGAARSPPPRAGNLEGLSPGDRTYRIAASRGAP
jgi:hypothetical protein